MSRRHFSFWIFFPHGTTLMIPPSIHHIAIDFFTFFTPFFHLFRCIPSFSSLRLSDRLNDTTGSEPNDVYYSHVLPLRARLCHSCAVPSVRALCSLTARRVIRYDASAQPRQRSATHAAYVYCVRMPSSSCAALLNKEAGCPWSCSHRGPHGAVLYSASIHSQHTMYPELQTTL